MLQTMETLHCQPLNIPWNRGKWQIWLLFTRQVHLSHTTLKQYTLVFLWSSSISCSTNIPVANDFRCHKIHVKSLSWSSPRPIPAQWSFNNWETWHQALVAINTTGNYSAEVQTPGVKDTVWAHKVFFQCFLTHWPLRGVAVSFTQIFKTCIKDRYMEYYLQNCFQMNATRPH